MATLPKMWQRGLSYALDAIFGPHNSLNLLYLPAAIQFASLECK